VLWTTGWLPANLHEYVFNGMWVYHLWFLNNLIVYFLSAYVIAVYANKLGMPIYLNVGGVLFIFSLLSYLPFFIFGAILHAERGLLLSFSKIPLLLSLSMIAVAKLMLSLINAPVSALQKVSNAYLESIVIWASVAICFNLFHRFGNAPSKSVRYMADSSYTIYLFHHIFVILFGLVLIEAGISAAIGLPLVCVAVLITTITIHRYFIQKTSFARLLFNGR